MKGIDSKARELLLLALGSPREPEPKFALEIILDALHSETRVLSDAHVSGVGSAHLLAIVCRLEALRELVTECVSVQWLPPASPAAERDLEVLRTAAEAKSRIALRGAANDCEAPNV